jgi:hypothetical protein
MKTDFIEDILTTIRAETVAMPGHKDPSALTDCWEEALEAISVLRSQKEQQLVLIDAYEKSNTFLREQIAKSKRFKSALIGTVEALENVDRHQGLLGGEHAKLKAARVALELAMEESK